MLRNPESLNAANLTFGQIQFPLDYNFPQDDKTGVVDRSFTQEAFNGGSSATLTNRGFSLVDPKTNMALSVTEDPDPILVRKVKLQHDSTDTNVLNIGEVEVYDQLGTINRALGKNASQSSDHGDFPASNAINGDPNTFSHTSNGLGLTGKLMLVFCVSFQSALFDFTCLSHLKERGGWWTCKWIFLFLRW